MLYLQITLLGKNKTPKTYIIELCKNVKLNLINIKIPKVEGVENNQP